MKSAKARFTAAVKIRTVSVDDGNIQHELVEAFELDIHDFSVTEVFQNAENPGPM